MFKFFQPLQECFNSNKGCGWTEIEKFVSALLNNLIIVGMFVAACTIAYAGYTLFQGRGDAGARSKARSILIGVVIGCIILFSAYFIVDLILTKLLVTKDFRGTI